LLRLVAAVRINAPIGAGVHVSNIFRKLGVCGWVQAAAVAERARPAGLRAGLTPPVQNLNTFAPRSWAIARSAPPSLRASLDDAPALGLTGPHSQEIPG